MRVLISGAGGFVGSNLAVAMVRNRHDVVCRFRWSMEWNASHQAQRGTLITVLPPTRQQRAVLRKYFADR